MVAWNVRSDEDALSSPVNMISYEFSGSLLREYSDENFRRNGKKGT
jgi:hypothetical protein